MDAWAALLTLGLLIRVFASCGVWNTGSWFPTFLVSGFAAYFVLCGSDMVFWNRFCVHFKRLLFWFVGCWCNTSLVFWVRLNCVWICRCVQYSMVCGLTVGLWGCCFFYWFLGMYVLGYWFAVFDFGFLVSGFYDWVCFWYLVTFEVGCLPPAAFCLWGWCDMILRIFGFGLIVRLYWLITITCYWLWGLVLMFCFVTFNLLWCDVVQVLVWMFGFWSSCQWVSRFGRSWWWMLFVCV